MAYGDYLFTVYRLAPNYAYVEWVDVTNLLYGNTNSILLVILFEA